MRPEGLLEGLLSGDAHRIWEAASGVTRLWDRDSLRWLAGHAAAIRAATEDVELGGALRPNRVILDLALKRMELARGEACFCGLYAKDLFANPKREAEDGFVRVISKQDNAETWETDWEVVCATCGTAYRVRQNDGWHIPTYAWAAAAT
jgi:hypothetical protein